MADHPALEPFSAPVRAWFSTSFPEPTTAQVQAWPAIARREHTLVLAPTGSGKTLTAFLWGIDRLMTEPVPEGPAARTHRTRIVYVSPLRALAVDVEKNLRSPLLGVALAAEREGGVVHLPTVGVRTGDTPPDERRKLVRHPPDLLITTPESLYLMLTSAARETLQGVDAVIVDEIHALVPTKRGSHLALSLERLEQVVDTPFQRIGLSATQRPLDEVARFLGGYDTFSAPDGPARQRPVTVIDAGVRKVLELEVVVPVEDMASLGEVMAEPTSGPAAAGPQRRSIWPSMHPRLLDLVQTHESTLIFVNARRLAERLATRLNELALTGESHGAEAMGFGLPTAPRPGKSHAVDADIGPTVGIGDHAFVPELVMAHHGSLSRERRLIIEDSLKRGELKGLVATSSLELGIDMGAIDLVVLVESPGSVASALQRVGRAGHSVGEPSRARLFPKHRADLLELAAVVPRMHQGLVESTRYLRNPLDVLAQQVVAMSALDEWTVADLGRVVRGAAGFADLSDELLANVLDLLGGRYPSEEFSELRPRIVWDRVTDTVRGRAGAQRLAVTNPGTIPDRGLFGVFLPSGARVGELDEEMVYESRPGETFLLGASTWRIEDITFDRVIVTPAPGQPGKMPFWHGDGPGRPLELGQAVGAMVRRLRSLPVAEAHAVLRSEASMDDLAATNLLQYLDDQAEATGAVPDDRTVVVERFRDEIGDWRVCVLTPFGARVHAPWGMALRARLAERWGTDVELIWSDDGIVLRLPDAIEELPVDELLIDPAEIEDLVVAELPSTAMFASRFREASARALLLPRRRPGSRTPLWQQRQRAADLLTVAARHPEFPMLLEATRECCNDVFDLPALKQVLTGLRSREVRLVPVETRTASPFASSLLFSWISVYMYEGDAPLAERRATALSLDRELLRDLLGAEELRELLDPQVLADLELTLQRLVDGRRARDADEVHDLLRELGPLSLDELAARVVDGAALPGWLDGLVAGRRAIAVAVAGEARFAAAEDAARLRDALGVAIPLGLPLAFTEPVADPLLDLVARYARTHGPFTSAEVAARYGTTLPRVAGVLERLEAEGRVALGEFRPTGTEREWCDEGVLRQLRRRSLSALRSEVEPVEPVALARFLPAWQGIGDRRTGLDAVAEALGSLQGAAVPASVLEADVLPARVRDYSPADLDALCASGEVIWIGAEPLGSHDGRVRLCFRDQAALLVAPVAPDADGRVGGPTHDALRAHLASAGASFWADLVAAVHEAGQPYDDPTVLAALWDLVWSGEVTNDTLAPLRALLASGRGRSSGSTRAGVGSRSGTASLAAQRARPQLGRRSVARAGSARGGGLRAGGPPAAAGRWSLVAPLLLPRPSATESAHAVAHQLLERHGVLTREAALGEGVVGGFAGIYPVLKALEERGHVRRGYFVAGLGAAQFALPGAVDRLRSMRAAADASSIGADAERDAAESRAEPVVLAATDPAQPYGAALAWPETSTGRLSRSAGARVVLVDGELCAFLERGGRTLVVLPAAAEHPSWPAGLATVVRGRGADRLEVRTIDGESASSSPWADALRAVGFTDGYRGLTLRR